MATKKMCPQNRINKQKEMEQKRRKRKKKMLITILIIILLTIIGAYLFASPTFKIQTITVTGNSQLTREKVLELADVKTGDNILLKFSKVLEVRLKQSGAIEEAKINKLYPSRIEIEITEKTKKFQINKSDISLQNIESGYIAEISSDSISVSLTGLKSELDKVTPDDIKAVVNLKGINSNKTVDVSLTVPNNTTLKNKVSVKVKVTKK